jgi:protein-glucosylgalactosylhydroxylysine glucosidase
MPLTRRDLLLTIPAALAAQSVRDRKSLIQRHNPVLTAFDPASPLSVGNGELAFSVDISGLQTFASRYEEACPLCTLSQWGWHSFPNPRNFSLSNFHMTEGGYPTESKGQMDSYNWLRENPHRLHLGRIAFKLPPGEPTSIKQTLDLWTGIITSHFEIAGSPVDVRTCVHPTLDTVAVTIESPLITKQLLGISISFPYGSANMSAADWARVNSHRTTVDRRSANHFVFQRELDEDRYAASIQWEGDALFSPDGDHQFLIQPTGAGFSFVTHFASAAPKSALTPVRECFDACRAHWPKFWSAGAAVASENQELERRVVLSQYLTAIQNAGSLPPQETGLTCNSWYGKFHLEMYWWNTAHFALWGRPELLQRSFGFYEHILPEAQATAKRQGFEGARWPKMVGPDGRESPSPVGPWLIWQQPHPIQIAELLYQAFPIKETLERYASVVFESAKFMTSFAKFDAEHSRYVLGPPLIPAQENHLPQETWNPSFELEYWADSLTIAQTWRKRLKLAPDPHWDEVRARLSPLPVGDGVYLAHENCPQTFTERNRDHPSMLMALGYLPGTMADPATMQRTYKKVLDTWKWPDTWGWDYGVLAMTAARLGDRKLALQALLMDTPKNRWLPNGHTPQRANLPVYLPSNGSLLSAVAMMSTWKMGI